MAYNRRGRGRYGSRSPRSNGYRSYASGRSRAQPARRRTTRRAAPAREVRIVIEGAGINAVSRGSARPLAERFGETGKAKKAKL